LPRPRERRGLRGRAALELFDFKEKFDLNCGVQWQGVGADGSACVAAGVAHDISQKLAGAVGDFRLIVKRGFTLHEYADAHDSDQAIPIAVQFGADDGQRVDRALGGRFLRRFQVHIGWNFSLGEQLPVPKRQLAADEEEIPSHHGGNVSADGFGRFGQEPAEVGEFAGDIHGVDDNLGKSEIRKRSLVDK